MVERLRSVPGVELAAINGSLQAGYASEDYQVEGWHDLVRLSPSRIGIRSGDNFRTTRLTLIAGRLLTEQDCSPGQQAVVATCRAHLDGRTAHGLTADVGEVGGSRVAGRGAGIGRRRPGRIALQAVDQLAQG